MQSLRSNPDPHFRECKWKFVLKLCSTGSVGLVFVDVRDGIGAGYGKTAWSHAARGKQEKRGRGVLRSAQQKKHKNSLANETAWRNALNLCLDFASPHALDFPKLRSEVGDREFSPEKAQPFKMLLQCLPNSNIFWVLQQLGLTSLLLVLKQCLKVSLRC